MAEKVRIFDTTLRDGEQSPGNSMNREEKLRLAHQLARLGADIIEAGFPVASEGDFEGVREVARAIRGPRIAGLARANPKDVDRCYEAVCEAESWGIHTFIATSDIHMQYKLRMDRKSVIEAAVGAVRQAKVTHGAPYVEFSAEDASRSDPDFLVEIFSAVIDAGADTINVPDTVGYAVPEEFAALIRKLKAEVRGINNAVISVHCHNDLGLATANSLAAVQAGARQIECCVNGIGERAGNTALEEVVMAIKTRHDLLDYYTDINTKMLWPSSQALAAVTGRSVQPNKAVVGANAFAHEAGIHQHGVLQKALTYEIMTPESVGLPTNDLVLGKHSGRHAFKDRLNQLGYELSDDDLNKAFKAFKRLADKKKEIRDEDLEAIMMDQSKQTGAERYELTHFHFSGGTMAHPVATIHLKVDGMEHEASEFGNGPVDAAITAIKRITCQECKLQTYRVEAISGTAEAQGRATLDIVAGEVVSRGQATDTDVIVASIKAFVNALNKLEFMRKRKLDAAAGA